MEANSITPTSLLSASTQHAYGYDPVGTFAANNTGDLRSEVKDAECNVRHDIGEAECSINTNVLKAESDIRTDIGNAKFQLHDNIVMAERNINNRFGLVDVAIVKSEYEAKLAAQTVIKEINANTNHVAERIQDRLDAIDTRFSDKVCDVERRATAGLNALSAQLAECCCKIEGLSAASTQTGLVNAIVNALNVKNGN